MFLIQNKISNFSLEEAFGSMKLRSRTPTSDSLQQVLSIRVERNQIFYECSKVQRWCRLSFLESIGDVVNCGNGSREQSRISFCSS